MNKGRPGTDSPGYQAMLAASREHADRIWAVEDCNGIGRHVAQRPVADDETVLDVPAKLSALGPGVLHRPRPHDRPGRRAQRHGRRLRTLHLRQVAIDDTAVALRLLIDRRDQLGRTRTEVACPGCITSCSS